MTRSRDISFRRHGSFCLPDALAPMDTNVLMPVVPRQNCRRRPPTHEGVRPHIILNPGHVILLLFQVGLESTVGQMVRVGLSSLIVATLGVVGPFVLGWGVGAWLVPSASHAVKSASSPRTSA
jgi:hypothetical protein